MISPIRAVAHAYSRCIDFFSLPEPQEECRNFGFGQFVLLLTLAPFALSLSLFSLGPTEQLPRHYEYRIERFERLPPLPPLPPGLTAEQAAFIQTCDRSQSRDPIFRSMLAPICAMARQADAAQKDQLQQALDERFKARALKHEKPPVTSSDRTITYSSEALLPRLHAESHAVTSSLFMLGLVLFLPVAWRCVRQGAWGLLLLGLCVPTAFLGSVALSLAIGPFNIQWIEPWLPRVAYAWFIWRGRLESPAFVGFVALAAALTLVTGLFTSTGILQPMVPLLLFVVATGVARLIVRGTIENAYILRNLGWRGSLRMAARATWLWLPMALLAVPCLVWTQLVAPRAITNSLHKAGVLVSPYGVRNLRDNVLESTARWVDDSAFQFHLGIEVAKREIRDQAQQLNDRGIEPMVMAHFDEVMPENLHFEPVDPDITWFKEVVVGGVELAQKGTNGAYREMRANMRAEVREIALQADADFRNKVVAPTEANLLGTLDKVRATEIAALRKANNTAQSAEWWAFTYAYAAHELALLLFAIVCVKSYLYVFARVSLHNKEGTFLTLGRLDTPGMTGVPPTVGAITATGSRYLLNTEEASTFYISRRFQCRGKPPRFAIPQPLGAPIARLLHGATAMNKVVMQAGDGPVTCTATRGAEFLEWHLGEGEVVVFDFHHFVGMTSTVRVSTLISPRLSTLLLGKFIFSTATGPGKLILMTQGRAEIAGRGEAAGSLPPERLVAMHRDTPLHVESELSFVDVYLSGAYVRPAANAPVIVDVDIQSGSTIGLGRFLRNFLWPL